MKMNTVLVAAVLAASVAVAKEAVWKSDGSGGWGSSKRWVNGNVPDPDGGETWTVKINDGDTAVVTDADKRYFECITSLSVGENAKLVVTNYSPLTFNFPMSGKGKVEIYGSGVVTQRYESTAYQYNNTGGWEIFDGVLVVCCPLSLSSSTVVQFRCPYGVWSPGVIEPDPTYSVQFRGLYGNGTVRDPTGGSIETITFAALSNSSGPCDFSGDFANFGSSFYITVNGARQIISNPATSSSLYNPRMFASGSLGFAAFPAKVNIRSGNGD